MLEISDLTPQLPSLLQFFDKPLCMMMIVITAVAVYLNVCYVFMWWPFPDKAKKISKRDLELLGELDELMKKMPPGPIQPGSQRQETNT